MSRKPLSDMELLLQIARESMERYGTALPPMSAVSAPVPDDAEAPSPGRQARRRVTAGKRRPAPKMSSSAETKRNPNTDWTKVKKTCPRCDKTKFVEPDFGLKAPRASEPEFREPQSWCKQCRSDTSKEYYAASRKYHRR